MKITILLDTFPTISETFLYTTIQNWQKAGVEIQILARKRSGANQEIPFHANVTYLPAESLPALTKVVIICIYLVLLSFRPGKLKTALRCVGHARGTRQKLQLAARCFPLFHHQTNLMYFPFGGLAVRYLEYLLETDARVIFSLRGSDIHYYPVVDRQYRQRMKDALLAADGIHCVCAEILERAEQLAGCTLVHGKVIFTALLQGILDHPTPKRVSTGRLEILSVGRLEWVKGLEHGIVAAHALRERGVDFRWRIIGEGEYRLPLQWAIRDMGLQDRVILCGSMKHQNVLQILQEADVFLHPSIHEGISNAVLEAMAVGLPVVASDVGGMREAISSTEVGFLVAPRDWKAMADALEYLACDRNLRENVGAKAREIVRSRFTAEKQTKSFFELFNAVMRQEPV